MKRVNVKRCLAFCLMLAAMVGCLRVAYGEINLTEQIQKESDFCVTGYISDSTAYLLGNRNLYVWRPGQEGLSAIPFRQWLGQMLSCFMRDGDLWVITASGGGEAPRKLNAVRLDIREGADNEDVIDLNLDCLNLDTDDYLSICSSQYASGRVYMTARVNNGDERLLECELSTGNTKIIRKDNVGKRLFATDDGRILAECIDKDKGTAWYEMYDPQSRTFTKHGGVFEYDRLKGGMVGAAWVPDCLYYQKDGLLKAAENAEPDKTAEVASVIRQCEDADKPAGIIDSRYYVYLTHSGAEVIDIDDYRERKVRFRVTTNTDSEAVVAAVSEMRKKHPDMMPIVETVDSSDYEIIDRLTEWKDDSDVYVVKSGTLLSEIMYFKDYLPEITDPAVIQAVSKMYPAIQEAVIRKGKVICVPVGVSGTTVGFNRDILEKLDKPGAELPTNFAELLDRLEELNLKTDGQTEYSIFPLNISARAIRTELIYTVLEAFSKDFAKNPSTGYHTPELIATLEKAVDLDLEKMGVDDETEVPESKRDVLPLMVNIAPTVCVEYEKDSEPLPVYVPKNALPGLPINITAAFINPYGKHSELAQEFMAEVIKHWDTTTQYTLSDEKNDPVPDPKTAEELARMQAERDRLATQLENAKEEDKASLKQELEYYDSELEYLKRFQWLMSQESIDRFRANAGKLFVRSYDYAASGETANLVQRLADGIISVDQFTHELDNKSNMFYREGF